MTLANVVTTIRIVIPELDYVFTGKGKDNLITESTGAHVVFGILFVPYIISMLKSQPQPSDLLLRVFAFFEEMALCKNEEVREVLQYSVLEVLGDDTDAYNEAQKFFLAETKRLSDEIEGFLGRR